ncbi:autotransporter adhesin precursor, putative [Anopheles sinensis]|uniref:Autotransporter adhesin, putative n=1 Tax=Anopheles sinensis TaxID=74873 RepID=A0A084WLS6_ANOSI|nr:autotransporter adhesin precursor, putative [Anopheles sinensis]
MVSKRPSRTGPHSKISLATREKTNTNHQRERPGSALHNRPCSAAGAHIRRPLSADSTQYHYRKRPTSSGSGGELPRQPPSPFHQFQFSKRSTSSSSLLLKSLLAEPIPRYWESKGVARSTQVPSSTLGSSNSVDRVGQQRRQQPQGATANTRQSVAKTKCRKRSSNSGGSKTRQPKKSERRRPVRDSTEEEEHDQDEDDTTTDDMDDTQESNNEAELEGIWRAKPSTNRDEKKRSPPLPMVALPLNRKPSGMASGGGLKKNNNSPEKQIRKVDLPGRVSFSSNDPYEIDYSDFEENEFGLTKDDPSKQPRKAKPPVSVTAGAKKSFSSAGNNLSTLYDERKFQETSMLEEVSVRFGGVKFEDEITTSSGYETKCDDGKSTLGKRPAVSAASPSPVCDVSESNKIIEDYKKEIEDLNRRHDMELRMAVDASVGSKPYDPKCFTPSDTPEDLFANSTSTKALESTTEDTDIELDRPIRPGALLEKNVINEYYECINEIITEQSPSKRSQNRPLPILGRDRSSDCHDGKEDPIQHNLNNECTKSGPKEKQFASSSGGVSPGKGKSLGSSTDSKNRLDSSTNPVIKNYFKVKEQNIVSASASSLASGSVSSSTTGSKSGHSKNTLLSKGKNGKEKPKSADTHKSILRNAKKQNNNGGSNGSAGSGGKFSSGLCREESNISEFHMDKVVSWMSCNEDTFPVCTEAPAMEHEGSDEQPRKCGATSSAALSPRDVTESTDRPQTYASSYEEPTRQRIEQREETLGSVQSNYDDDSVASGSAKQKSDFQALKNEVEYRLSNILDCTDSQVSSGCEGDPSSDHPTQPAKGKVKDLFSYLDQVELKCEKSAYKGATSSSGGVLPSESDRSELEFAAEPDYMEAVPKMTDLLELPQHQLARRVIKLSLRANELSNAMQLSKDHIATVKADKVKAIRTEKCALLGKLKEQKKHYEDIIGRHQEFIDQLIKDKSGLCDKVTQLTRRLDSQNQSWEHRLKTELERARDTALAAEKIRREKWVRENTKKIKELTVKGLELEINKMTAAHQKEIGELKRQHKDEMVCALGELKLQYEQKEADVRQGLTKERETTLERERQALLERFDRQVTEERSIFEQQRQHLLSEFDLEKERLQKEAARKAQYAESQLEDLKRENAKNLEFAQKEYVQMLKQREAKHQEELTKLQKQFESDFAIWKREHERKSKVELEERENEIRAQCRTERDQQIDRIVAKVDAETQKYQQEFDAKMNRLKEKHDAEQKEAEAAEALMKQKYQDSRVKQAEAEATIQNMKATAKQTELQLSHAKKLCDDLLREKETMREEARREVQKDMANMQREREREIERIYCRVQQAIDKKDATIATLQKEIAVLKERCLKQDAVIRQQRIDYCIK